MKIFLIKIFIFTSLFCLGTTDYAKAANLTISTYYPSLNGEYKMYRLMPRSSDLSGTCTLGALYVNSAATPQYCKDRDSNGSSEWGSIPGLWEQNGDLIFLTDGVTNPSLKVGIGTTTPSYKLTLLNDAGIYALGTFGSGNTLTVSGAGTRLIWYPRKAAFRAGYVSGSQWDDSNIGNYSSALGRNSTASGTYSVVGGGDGNTASGQYSAVIGGQTNTASGAYSSIVGGKSNNAAGAHANILGGELNNVTDNLSSIMGGKSNTVSQNYSTIVGGNSNTVSLSYSTIIGGKSNTINVLCGLPMVTYSSIGGGNANSVRNIKTIITGGVNNSILGQMAYIGGGYNNIVGSNSSCAIQGNGSNILGGQNNKVFANYSSIIGGFNNTIFPNSTLSSIGGGAQNQVTGPQSSISGGARNTVNSTDSSFIVGGSDNTVNSSLSQAEGKYTQISSTANETFAWGYSDSANPITAADSFIIAPGSLGGNPWFPKFGLRDISPVGVMEINANSTMDNYINITKTSSGDVFVIKNNGYIGVNKPTPTITTHVMQFGNASDAYLTSGGVWTNGSSRERKKDIHELSSADAQSIFDQLTPVTYNYKLTPDRMTAGFIAEDVPQALSIQGGKSLSSMDIIAVLTKVAQDQQEQINHEVQRINLFKKELKELRKRLGDPND